MPIYEYECPACERQGEFVATVAKCQEPPDCECGSPTNRVILSAPMGYVHFPAAGGQGYVSHTSGKYIDTKRARVDDLARSGCRPWEGLEQETKQKAKDRAHEEKKDDAKLEASVRKAYHELPPEKRAVLD